MRNCRCSATKRSQDPYNFSQSPTAYQLLRPVFTGAPSPARDRAIECTRVSATRATRENPAAASGALTLLASAALPELRQKPESRAACPQRSFRARARPLKDSGGKGFLPWRGQAGRRTRSRPSAAGRPGPPVHRHCGQSPALTTRVRQRGVARANLPRLAAVRRGAAPRSGSRTLFTDSHCN